jgi:hypothetical protein
MSDLKEIDPLMEDCPDLNGFYAFHPRVRVLGLVDLGAPPLVSGQRFDFLSGI